jgi:cellobiose epimerase
MKTTSATTHRTNCADLKSLAASARLELLENILPFWRQRTMDERCGGFIGWMSNDLRLDQASPKGLILNARLLWTFSAAFRFTRASEDAGLAHRAYEYLIRHFHDAQHGGYYWELDPAGAVLDDKKKCYGQAFVVYALAEYDRTFQNSVALQQAIDLYRLLEAHAADSRHGGYFEVLARDWALCEDMRLGTEDLNEKKSMNNHLHVLEAWTNLYRVWPDPGLADRLGHVIVLFLERILNASGTHFHHFFDETWAVKSDSYTFGHDIEGSWLLWEAADILGQPALRERVRAASLRLAHAVLEEGLDADGGLLYEGRQGQIINPDKEWWPQAEAVVGFINAWALSGEDRFLAAASRCWNFIQEKIVDHQHGEWFWRVSRDGAPDPAMPKVSPWKCPYHNGRCCLELIHRVENTTENP